MRLTTNGIAVGVTAPIVGRITTREVAYRNESVLLTTCDDGDFDGYRAVLTTARNVRAKSSPYIVGVQHTDQLHEGDVVAISPKGLVRTVFLRASSHNTLFI